MNKCVMQYEPEKYVKKWSPMLSTCIIKHQKQKQQNPNMSQHMLLQALTAQGVIHLPGFQVSPAREIKSKKLWVRLPLTETFWWLNIHGDSINISWKLKPNLKETHSLFLSVPLKLTTVAQHSFLPQNDKMTWPSKFNPQVWITVRPLYQNMWLAELRQFQHGKLTIR